MHALTRSWWLVSLAARARRDVKLWGILAASGLLVAASHSTLALAVLARIQVPGALSSSFLALLFALALPGRLALLGVPMAVAALGIMEVVNGRKIAVLGLPVTSFDVKLFVENPSVLANAMGVSGLKLHGAALGLATAVGAVCALLAYAWRRHGRHGGSSFPITHAAAAALVLVAARHSLTGYGEFAYARVAEADVRQDLWLPETQVELSRELGVPEYLAFTSVAGSRGVASALPPSSAPLPEDIRLAAAAHLENRAERTPGRLPNIVFFHAESTFDPNRAFHLDAPIELDLWSGTSATRLVAPLRVNVIGGGSWVTEFEVLTGVDARVFGYHGFYTHYFVAPITRSSFVRYLGRLGYRSVAFYPVEGAFYNTEQAFLHYGFDEFIDGRALGLPSDWGSLLDTVIVRAVVERGAFAEPGPFFYFIGTSENHGPHRCDPATADPAPPARFAVPAPHHQTCQLNEYIRRARSTSAAFDLVAGRLREIEATTGRPFLLLAYGDHQPWSFTDGLYSVAGGTAREPGHDSFHAYRTGADAYQTFVHVAASESLTRELSTPEPVPAWLLPSLVSTLLAPSYEDLYLPITFYAYARCGADLMALDCGGRTGIAHALRAAILTEPDPAASFSMDR